jgi:hypothetical protein
MVRLIVTSRENVQLGWCPFHLRAGMGEDTDGRVAIARIPGSGVDEGALRPSDRCERRDGARRHRALVAFCRTPFR